MISAVQRMPCRASVRILLLVVSLEAVALALLAQQASSRPNNPEAALLRSIRSAPGSGVRPDTLVAVLHEGRGVYQVTGYQFVESVDLLLKDGSVYRNLRIPPEDLNIEASRRLEPDEWTRWKRDGNGIALQNPKTGRWDKAEGVVVRPLQQGSQLSRRLINRTAHSFGGMGGSVFTTEFRFLPDGHFERSRGSLSGTGTVQAAGGYSSSSAGSVDKAGRRGSAVGSGSMGDSSVTAWSASSSREGSGDMLGTYRVDGFALELRTQSGLVDRFLAFYPFAKDDRIYIDGATFKDE
jgi:hypothetical protein